MQQLPQHSLLHIYPMKYQLFRGAGIALWYIWSPWRGPSPRASNSLSVYPYIRPTADTQANVPHSSLRKKTCLGSCARVILLLLLLFI